MTAPSQSPVPVGFLPAVKPRAGANLATSAAEGAPAAALLAGTGTALAGAGAAAAALLAPSVMALC